MHTEESEEQIDQGTYIVFEGPDGIGKTTLIENVHKSIPGSILSKHPGATPLGRVIRKLTKTPDQFIELAGGDEIIIDEMSVQVLMMVDQIAFIESILKPSLNSGKIVLADRINFISAIAYGLAEGLSTQKIGKLISLCESPVPDKVYILRLTWEELLERKFGRKAEKDRFEDQGLDFLRRVYDIYMNITNIGPEVTNLISSFVPVERIEYINANRDPKTLSSCTSDIISSIHLLK